MVSQKVTTSSQLAVLYFVLNWASDQNNYIAEVMVAMVVAVVIEAAIKVAAAEMAK